MEREKFLCCRPVRGFRFRSFLLECKALFGSRQAGSAALAQLVEQFIRNEEVDSSIPSSGTILIQQDPTQKPLFAAFFVAVGAAVSGCGRCLF